MEGVVKGSAAVGITVGDAEDTPTIVTLLPYYLAAESPSDPSSTGILEYPEEMEVDNELQREVKVQRQGGIKKSKRNYFKRKAIELRVHKAFKDGLQAEESTMHGLPEVKPAMVVGREEKPEFFPGHFIQVTADTLPEKNRPVGCGYVESVRGVGMRTVTTVTYEKESNDGLTRLPAKIPLYSFYSQRGHVHKDVPYSAMMPISWLLFDNEGEPLWK
mmetsp:Transcript_47753/g.144408  ORF Transcript_47753/g.144408 Transcript_47753/m.144408 type:complete len:217 (-) Transcript_47753:1913-2563(-)